MYLLRGVLLCVIIATSTAEWLKNLISPRSIDLGNGLILHMRDSRKNTTSFWERHIISMDYAGYGLSLVKAHEKDAVQVGIYTNSLSEARGKKGDYGLMYVMMGYKMATILAIGITFVGVLAMKALGVASIAAIISKVMLASKLLHHHHQKEDFSYHQIPTYMDIDQPGKSYALSDWVPSGDVEPHSSGSTNFYSYSNYNPSSAAENSMNYSSVDSIGNATIVTPQPLTSNVMARRRDGTRKKNKTPLLTIHQYTVKS